MSHMPSFFKKHELPFTLLADTEHKVRCEAYGVWKEKNMYGRKSMGVERTSFVIDFQGRCRRVLPKVKVDGHNDAVLTASRPAVDVRLGKRTATVGRQTESTTSPSLQKTVQGEMHKIYREAYQEKSGGFELA